MKAYCINLERRPDRKTHMGKQFQRLDMVVEWFPAVDGSLPEVAAQTASLGAGRTGRSLGPGAYACFQSHRAIWKHLMESGADHAMVLEDDLVIADGFGEYLKDGWVPKDADLVKLEARGVRAHLERQITRLNDGRYLSRLRSSHFGTGGYVISAEAADRLYRLTETVRDAIDEIIFDELSPLFDSLKIYQMVPAPVIQGDRLPKYSADAAWSQTSIELRFGAGENPESAKPESRSLSSRIRLRVKAEIRALQRGTRYSLVPYG
jgi:glycosyl transferase family 25